MRNKIVFAALMLMSLTLAFESWRPASQTISAKEKSGISSTCSTASFIPGKRIFYTPPEGGRYAAIWLADVGANTNNPGILGARLDQICTFGVSVTLKPDGSLMTVPIPPDNALLVSPVQIVIPSALWRFPTEFECSELQ